MPKTTPLAKCGCKIMTQLGRPHEMDRVRTVAVMGRFSSGIAGKGGKTNAKRCAWNAQSPVPVSCMGPATCGNGRVCYPKAVEMRRLTQRRRRMPRQRCSCLNMRMYNFEAEVRPRFSRPRTNTLIHQRYI